LPELQEIRQTQLDISIVEPFQFFDGQVMVVLKCIIA